MKEKNQKQGVLVEIKFAIKIMYITIIKGTYKFKICLKILFLKRFRSFVSLMFLGKSLKSFATR